MRWRKLVLEIVLLLAIAVFYIGIKNYGLFQENADTAKKVLFSITVIFFSFILAKILNFSLRQKIKRSDKRTPNLLNKIISITVFVIGLLIILSHLEVEITPLIAALGIGGIVIGLALQPTLSNFFSGVYIISDKTIKIGDYVELEGGLEGYVEDIRWRSTKIKTLPNKMITIPNSKLAEGTITNTASPDKEIAALVQVGVDYKSDLKKVEKITVDTARKIQKSIEGAVPDFEPFIRYHTFAESNINFTVILRVKSFVDKYLVTHEFIKELKSEYDKQGIEISWPIRKVTNFK